MKVFFGVCTIIIGIISGFIFFDAGSKMIESGKRMEKLGSVAGTTVAEGYYNAKGSEGVGFGILAKALGWGIIAVSIGLGGLLIFGNNDRNYDGIVQPMEPVQNLKSKAKENREEERVQEDKEVRIEQGKVQIVEPNPEEYEYLRKIIRLGEMIRKEKNSFFGSDNKQEILTLMADMVKNKQDAQKLIENYRKQFNRDIVDDLKRVTSSYNTLKEYLGIFIDYKIVKDEFPHGYIHDII